MRISPKARRREDQLSDVGWALAQQIIYKTSLCWAQAQPTHIDLI